MKKIFLLLGLASALVLAGCGPQKTVENSSAPTSGLKVETLTPGAEVKESYFLKNGVMMVFRNGQYSNMEKEISLQDGSIVGKTGLVRRKDGTTFQLKEGQSITVDGRILEPPIYK
ncbi:hypothetical protein HY030_04600 [Candidatus Gottesmanbacteria bacterium]|nr:hypothetical protein [Candidatus Gottesmanbacteria bacterium]